MSGPLLTPPSDVAAEVDVSDALVRRLLADQFPDLADEPLRRFAEGWDNTLFRIGEDWIARFPRRALAAPLVAQELRWLPELAPRLPLLLPVPRHEGMPAADYPWCWSISEWIPGRPAAAAELDAGATAETFARFLSALHRIETPPDGPTSAMRGVSPRERSEPLLAKLGELDSLLGHARRERLERTWRSLCATPDWDGRPVWCHGDLHPFNLLAQRGRLAAVLDWGEVHVREPAPDLAAAWMLLPPSAHARFLDAYGGLDDATWERGKAWATYFGVMFVHAGSRGAGEAATRVGLATLDRLLG